MELLEKDPAFSDYAVVSMYYRSGLLQGDPTIAQLATSFAAWLDKHFDKNTEIIIIAHSLGGIIARQGLVQCDFKNRKDQFVTLITLASPFDGSNLPDFSRLLATFRISSRQLDALRLRSDALELCENGWIDLVKIHGQRIRQFAAAEGRSTKGIVVVSEESATRKVPRNCVFRSDEDDHLSIAKPSSLEAGIGKQVRDWIINRRYNEGDYIIGYNLQIPAAGSLVIESGTKITFKDAKFIVKGRVDAAGTQSKPVKFAFESTSGEDTAIVLRGESVAKSRFEYCTFQKGHGVGVKKPGPQTFRKSSRKDAWGEKETTLTSKALHYGGAMTLIGTNDVTISKCEFVENEAYQGGALALLGCVRVKIEDSRFQKNVSGFGGGAIFAQASDFEVRSNCRFEQNSTGQMVAAYKDVSDARFACGGAVYLGYMARCNIDHDVFEENKASNSGGAIYIQDSHPAGSENIAGSELTELVFSANESRNDGAAVYVAGESRGVISSPTFKDNVVGSKPAEDGASCVDQSKVGLAVTNAAWIRNGEPYIDECRRPTK
jgi:predicted outer membrane repeat protein